MVTLAFATTSMIVLLTPGPTNTVLAACGAAMGFRRAALMPIAEAIGYAIAISAFVAFAALVRDNAVAFAAIRLLAAAWLVYSAYRLWRTPFEIDPSTARNSFARVLLTTIVNPKAMLVGTILIPAAAFTEAPAWIGTYVALSTIAGLGWVLIGSLLPMRIRRHSYKLASVVLGGFSLAAIASVAAA